MHTESHAEVLARFFWEKTNYVWKQLTTLGRSRPLLDFGLSRRLVGFLWVVARSNRLFRGCTWRHIPLRPLQCSHLFNCSSSPRFRARSVHVHTCDTIEDPPRRAICFPYVNRCAGAVRVWSHRDAGSTSLKSIDLEHTMHPCGSVTCSLLTYYYAIHG